MEEILKKALKINILVALAGALVLVLAKKLPWAGGFLIGAVWSTVNFLFLANILKIAILKKDRKKLAALLLMKFPVLYLAGFLVLSMGIFPPLSLLAGLSLILVVMGLIKLWPNQR
jgi:hypothetical protein